MSTKGTSNEDGGKEREFKKRFMEKVILEMGVPGRKEFRPV